MTEMIQSHFEAKDLPSREREKKSYESVLQSLYLSKEDIVFPSFCGKSLPLVENLPLRNVEKILFLLSIFPSVVKTTTE